METNSKLILLEQLKLCYPKTEIIHNTEKREEIITILKNIGYTYVTLDLGGIKSGSMDIEILRK